MTQHRPWNKPKQAKAPWTMMRPEQIVETTAQKLAKARQRKADRNAAPKLPKYRGPLAQPLAPPKERTRIRPVSKGAAGRKRRYRIQAEAYILKALADPARRYCPVALAILGRKILVRDVHHMRGRLGPLLFDERYWMAASREGHDWIHANLAEAAKRGWVDLENWNKETRLCLGCGKPLPDGAKFDCNDCAE